jgi:hypothetical protein
MEGGALQLGLAVLDGAASSQTGAGTLATHGSSGESVTGTITTTETGSQVFLAAAVNHNPETFTPTGTTSTMWIYNDTTGGDEQILGQLTSPTGTPGATSVGWTDSASGDWSLVAVEILAAGVAEVDVPNVVGMTEAAATAAITAAGFVAAGPLVASQSPTAGTAAAPGSTVTITL